MAQPKQPASNRATPLEALPAPYQPSHSAHVVAEQSTSEKNNGKGPKPTKAAETDGAATVVSRTTTTSQPTVATSPKRAPERIQDRWVHFISILSAHWGFEILSCILACACLALMAGILARYQNKALPNWPNLISINTIIAVGSTILKDALRVPVAEGISQLKWLYFYRSRPLSHFEDFDSASRGPWSAFLFLFSKQRRYLACLGSLITVFILAIDPFAQQVIQYYNCLGPTTSQARISRTNNYTTGGYQTQALFAEPDGPMAAALYLGALNPPKTETESIAFECATGNCTFPSSAENGASFSSLAMCSFCKEVPEKILFNETSDTWYTEPWSDDLGCKVGKVYPESPDLPYQLLHVSKVLALEDTFDEFINLQFLTLNIDDTCDTSTGNATTCPKTPWAVECSLYACVKTYRSRIERNGLEETVLEEISLRQTNLSAEEVTRTENLTWSLAVSSVLESGTARSCLLSPTPTADTPVAISRNNTLQSGQDPDDTYTTYTEPSCVYVLGFTTALALNQLFSVMFDANPLGAPREDTINTQGDTWLRNFYRNGTVTLSSASQYFEGITRTLTGLIREYGDSSRDQGWAAGTQMGLQTCVRVRWAWFVFPVVIVGMTIAFMGLTFLKCVVNGVWKGAWRSSALASYFIKIEGLEEINQKTRRDDIDAMAERVSVKIENDRFMAS